MTNAQRKALDEHRRRRRQAGMVRLEVQAPAADAPMLRDLAAILRSDTERAEAVRAQLSSLITQPKATSAYDIFGSDLPDAYFEGVFEAARRRDPPREVDL